jgi:membrane protease YdiL (CAAX protease family)
MPAALRKMSPLKRRYLFGMLITGAVTCLIVLAGGAWLFIAGYVAGAAILGALVHYTDTHC